MKYIFFSFIFFISTLNAQQENVELIWNTNLEKAQTLEKQNYISRVEPTETNIVIFYLQEGISEEKFINDLLQKNVKISSMGQGKLRIVTHYDYTAELHEIFLDILSTYK